MFILTTKKQVPRKPTYKPDRNIRRFPIFCRCIQRKPDRQRTYNVTLRRVLATIVAVEKQWVLRNLSVCICSLRYPACNAHAPYFRLWPAPVYYIFPHFHINGTIFEKKKKEETAKFKMRVLIYSTTFSVLTFLILKISKLDVIKNIYWSSGKVTFILVRF
jgi:hypothetical protein